MYSKQKMTAKEEFQFNDAVSRLMYNLLDSIKLGLQSAHWIADRFIYGIKPITRKECDALFEAERILLEDFIKKGETDNLDGLINLFYDPIKFETLSELEQKRSKKLQEKEFNLYIKAINEQLESIALSKKTNPEVLKGIMVRLFEDFEGTEPWDQTMRILDNPLEEYLFREKIKEAELLGQNDQAEYLIEADTGVPFS